MGRGGPQTHGCGPLAVDVHLRVPIATSERAGNYELHPFWTVLLDQLWVR
jgi:hypothetical protein